VSVYLCVQILSAHPLKSISGCSSGIVIVFPSQIYVYQFLNVTHPGCSSRRGLNAKQAEYAVKKYHSHSRVGAGIMMDMGILNNPE